MKKLFSAVAFIAAFSMLSTACAADADMLQTSLMPALDSSETTVEISSASVSESDISDTSAVKAAELKTPEEVTAALTLEQKACQMLQPAIYNVSEKDMTEHNYGSILSTFGEFKLAASTWLEMIRSYQKAALSSDSGVPFVYGNDSVHGVNYCEDAVIFPHNIGIGAADDEELTFKMGQAVADEAKLTGMIWNFAPCVAVSSDPRWGRTYESYSSDAALVKKLGVAFSKGQLDGGVMPCAKHFFADGNVVYGTGENSDVSRIIDRGDAQLTNEEIDRLLDVYQGLIDAGVRTVMISHSSLNGVKMHENSKYIAYLKNEMGFDGMIVSDWNSVNNITGADNREKTVKAVNAGIDMLMQVDNFEDCVGYIVDAVNSGEISEDRVNDAVTRIISVKMDMGLFDDPMMENITTKQSEVGSDEYRQLAETLAEESLVLLKNDGTALPVRDGAKIFVTGPAANDTGVQCGGWTIIWNGRTDAENGTKKLVESATTVLEGFEKIAAEHNITVVTDEKDAADADLTVLCIGEKPYAEWNGDTEDLSITGKLGLNGNKAAIEAAEKLGKPVVACIFAGRNVIYDEYEDKWDSVVMCYLPGSEGGAVANVLCGDAEFRGTLPMPYYSSTDDIGTENYKFPLGYGLKY